MMQRLFVLMLAMSGASTVTLAQTASTETLLDGDIDNGFLVAPDFKLTEVDRDFGVLGGAYGGWVINRKLLLGGGVYTLLDGANGAEMTYGGGVVEYFVNPEDLVNFSFRGLVGGGSATLADPFRRGFDDDFDLDDFDFPVNLPGFGRGPVNDLARQFHRQFPGLDFPASDLTRSSSFFIAEPEANVNLNVTEWLRLGFGGGYRFIGGARGLDERLDGFFASAALKLSFF